MWKPFTKPSLSVGSILRFYFFCSFSTSSSKSDVSCEQNHHDNWIWAQDNCNQFHSYFNGFRLNLHLPDIDPAEVMLSQRKRLSRLSRLVYPFCNRNSQIGNAYFYFLSPSLFWHRVVPCTNTIEMIILSIFVCPLLCDNSYTFFAGSFSWMGKSENIANPIWWVNKMGGFC